MKITENVKYEILSCHLANIIAVRTNVVTYLTTYWTLPEIHRI